jgi:hypothetical protein
MMPMAKKKMTFDTVRNIGLKLPGVEDGTTYGTPALKVGGKMFTCIPSHKSAEPDSLAVRIDFAQRDELVAADPDTYYLKDHYLNYPVVLVRLSRVHEDALRELLNMAWRYASTTRKRPARRPTAPGRPRRAYRFR